jgi:hypothetical protein
VNVMKFHAYTFIGCILGLAAVAMVVHRVYYEYHPVLITVANQVPMPANFEVALANSGITNTTLTAFRSRPYGTSTNEHVSLYDLSRIRRILAWKRWRLLPIENITIESQTNVVIYFSEKSLYCVEFNKRNGEWNEGRVRTGHVDRVN